MRKLYSRYKWLTIFLGVSIVIVISYYASYNLPELFSGAGRLFDFANQISIGYIINFLFFLLNIYLPQLDAEKKAFQVCNLPIVSLLEEVRRIENVFSSFITLKHTQIRYPTGIVYYQYPDSGGRSFIDITSFLKNEFASIQRRFSAVVSNRHFGSLDAKIIELINDMQYSDFLRYMSILPYHDGDLSYASIPQNAYSDAWEDAYNKFISLALELQKFIDANISEPRVFTVLEGDARDSYIAYIMAKRAECNVDARTVGEYHIENNRIY